MAAPPPARLAQAARRLSTLGAVRRPVVGARVDTSGRYTDTGGSGLDSTSPSRSGAERGARARALYRAALRDVDNTRINFTVVEDAAFVRSLIRDLFERTRNVPDAKVADMLLFKANQELGEIRNQYKGRSHVGQYINAYHAKLAAEAAAAEAAGGDGDAGADARQRMVDGWSARGLVPKDVRTWPQYERWKNEDEARFAEFAAEKGLFTRDELRANADAKAQCSVM
jgi:hypothetical protein